MRKLTTEPTSLLSYDTFKFYRELHKNSTKKSVVRDKQEFFRIAYAIFKEIAIQFTDSTQGLILKGIGYFCIWRSPKKKVLKLRNQKKYRSEANYHTDGYQYHPTIITNVFDKDYLKGWSMDRLFINGIKKKIVANLFKGVKYKLKLSIVKTFYTTNQEI